MKRSDFEKICNAYNLRRGYGRKLAGIFGLRAQEHLSIAAMKKVIQNLRGEAEIPLGMLAKILMGFLENKLEAGKASSDAFESILNLAGLRVTLPVIKVLIKNNVLRAENLFELQKIQNKSQAALLNFAVAALQKDEFFTQSSFNKIIKHPQKFELLEIFKNLSTFCVRVNHKKIFDAIIDQNVDCLNQKLHLALKLSFFLNRLKIEMTPDLLAVVLQSDTKRINNFVMSLAGMASFDKIYDLNILDVADSPLTKEQQWKTIRAEGLTVIYQCIKNQTLINIIPTKKLDTKPKSLNAFVWLNQKICHKLATRVQHENNFCLHIEHSNINITNLTDTPSSAF